MSTLLLAPGHIVAKNYRVVTTLGRGGMGTVYRAINIALDKPVALKILHERLADQDDTVVRFINEGIAASKVHHPAIIDVYDAGLDEELPWIALELLEGETLDEFLGRAGVLEPAEAVFVVSKVLDGLHAAHEHGIVHRDMKPDNVFLALEGDGTVQPKILDFGIAKLHGPALTATEAVLGTAYYLSPEQAESSAKVDRRTDIYAVGVMLYELLSGELPHEGDNFVAVIRNLFDKPPIPLSDRVPDLPAGLADLVMRCLAHDLDARPQTARELAQGLLALVPPGFEREIRPAAASGPLTIDDTADTMASKPSTSAAAGRSVPADTVASKEGAAPALRTPSTRGAMAGWVIAALVATTLAVMGIGALLADGATDDPPRKAAGAPGLPGEPVTMVWPPALDRELVLKESEPLRAYLEEGLDRPVAFVVTEDYEKLAEDIAKSRVAFAMMPPLLYIKHKAASPGIVDVASREFDGVTDVDAVLAVVRKGGVTSVEDTRGKTWCMTQKNSSTTYLAPRAFLRSRGAKPEAWIGKIHWSLYHYQVLRDLLAGKCEVAATHTGVLQTADQADIPKGQISTLTNTMVIPHDLVIAAPDIDKSLVAEVRRLLLAFDPYAIGRRSTVGLNLRITGFKPPALEPYKPLMEALRAEGSATRTE